MKFLLVCAALMLCIILTFGQQGDWAEWAAAPCSTTCGAGTRIRTRECTPPTSPCFGSGTETRSCNLGRCGRTGEPWRSWGSWSRCSKTCGTGISVRIRRCPLFRFCFGVFTQERSCNIQPCRGTWATWTAAPCSTSCGVGTRIRTRQCTPPTSSCFGSNTDQQSCNMGRCLRNREPWQPWGGWSQCSKTCGNGISVRSRQCSLLRFCFGVYTQERACNNQPCFGTVLNRWGPCSKTCGWGTQTRKACAQCPTEYQSCKTADCTGTCNPPSIRRYGLQSHDCCTNTLTPGSCGISSVGSAQSVVNRFPWIGYLWTGKDFCATVLIKNSFSLVAADCVWGKQVNELFVVFGVNANDVYNSPNEQNIFVQRFYIHPSYTPSNNQNFNIAILQFRNSVSLTSFVRPVCLPQGENVQSDLQCIALEWQTRSGSTGTYTTRNLRESFLRILPKGACNLNADPLRQSSLCAGPNNAQAGNCEKLSGTPLVCQRCSSCAWMVAGISHQNSCSNPTASQRFTQVSFYQDWIDGIVPPSNSQIFFPSCP